MSDVTWRIRLKQAIRFGVPYGLVALARRWRVPASAPEPPAGTPMLLPVRPLEALFPGISHQPFAFVPSQIPTQHHWALPLAERLVLGAICQHLRPRRSFEIGTYTGASTLVMALNTPDDAHIDTLDLTEAERRAIGAPDFALGHHVMQSACAAKVTQRYGDSRSFDFAPYAGAMDLVFIDANHTYPFVRRDSEVAFTLLRAGGVIIWDDYVWQAEHPECAGVAEYLNGLKDTGKCFQIAGTRLAIWRESFADQG